MNVQHKAAALAFATSVGIFAAGGAFADNETSNRNACKGLPTHEQLKTALINAVKLETSGLDMEEWATIVSRDGIVCAVAFSGADRQSQWPGSRVISAQKANTANSFSLPSPAQSGDQPQGLALATANLYSSAQPGGFLYGLQFSNPVDPDVAYRGEPERYGQANDPMVGRRIGGVNVFGGGLALYNEEHKVVGALGASGDTSCADHMIAWRIRNTLKLDHLHAVKGVSGDPERPDNIVFDIANGQSASGYGHPKCPNLGDAASLPAVRP